MEKYLFLQEKERISLLTQKLAQKLNKTKEELQPIEKKFYRIIKETKDSSIEEILDVYFTSLQEKMKGLLDERITPAVQFGLQNKNFSIISYGGNQNGDPSSKEITEKTFFSLDSISKLPISALIMQQTRDKKLTLNSKIHNLDNSFQLEATIESILKFTAMIKTEKRIDGLGKEETIAILKRCKEDIVEKSKYHNFYQYNDIGYMILRLTIQDFLDKMDHLLQLIDTTNLTYHWDLYKNSITGGKIGEEYITPDQKGRDILFPGHTGLYGNITGLINLFTTILNQETILTKEELATLFKQPYPDPIVYNKDGSQLIGKNQSKQYMAKIAGVYRLPTGICEKNYSKIASCDMSTLTTPEAKASTGTCGSWIVTDNLSYQNHFGTYVGGILTNPYSFVEPGNYKEDKNTIPNTNLIVNSKGIILGYQTKLNKYKELITEYGLLLELITEYINCADKNVLAHHTYQLTRKIH